MAVTRTFSIIKPDATRRNITGAVTKMLEEAGLRVVASKRIHMSKEQAEGFYAVHKERPFFGELVDFMISGPCGVQVLEGENAMQANLLMLLRVRSARNWPKASKPTPSTAATAKKMRRSKSPISSMTTKSSANPDAILDASRRPVANIATGRFLLGNSGFVGRNASPNATSDIFKNCRSQRALRPLIEQKSCRPVQAGEYCLNHIETVSG